MWWKTLVVVVGLLLAAGLTQSQTQSQGRVRVVSSFSVVGDIVQRVGGDRIEHRVLVGTNSDSHTYEPSPADSAALAGAALVVENGLGFEPWLDRNYAASGSRATRVALAENLPTLLTIDGEHGHEAHSIDDEHGHAEGDFDPHVWHDLDYAVRMVAATRDALSQADPANATFYEASAASYIAELQDLDAWIYAQVNTLDVDRRKLVTSHDTFRYFARRYQFEIVGTALGTTTEAADPSAGEIAALIEEIREAGVPAIFAENVSNPRLMQQIASAAGVQLVSDLYTDALGDRGTPGETLPGMIRHNVTSIVSALR